MLELAALATTVVTKFLVPLLTKGKDKLTEDLAESGSRATANALTAAAQKLWGRVRGRLDRPEERQVVDMFAEDSEDMDRKLSKVLAARLAEDPEFEKEVRDVVEQHIEGDTVWHVMADTMAVVDARNAHIGGHSIVAGMYIAGGLGPKPSPPTYPSDAPAGEEPAE